MDSNVENDVDYPFPLNLLIGILTKLFKINTILVLISSLVWMVMAFCCLKKYNDKYRTDLLRFAYVTFLSSALNSTMGVTEIFFENVMSSMRTLLELLQASLALPCLATEVWLKYQVAQKEVAWLHTVIGLIPTYIFLFQHFTRQDLIDFTVVMNMMSLVGVGIVYHDIYAVGSSLLMFLAYCVFFFRSELSYEPLSRQAYNYCMAFFTLFAYKCVI